MKAKESPVPRESKVLFLCAGNSARSSMAEAILNRLGPPRFRGYSAGSNPRGEVHPETLRLLNALGYDTATLRSKSWSEFVDAPVFDHIVTLCNAVAGEVCPITVGKPARAHWDIPNPAVVRGVQIEIEAAFLQVYQMLATRIVKFVRP